MQHADNSFVKLPAGTWGQGHTYLDHAGSYHIPGCCDSQVGKVVSISREISWRNVIIGFISNKIVSDLWFFSLFRLQLIFSCYVTKKWIFQVESWRNRKGYDGCFEGVKHMRSIAEIEWFHQLCSSSWSTDIIAIMTYFCWIVSIHWNN